MVYSIDNPQAFKVFVTLYDFQESINTNIEKGRMLHGKGNDLFVFSEGDGS